MQIRSIALPLCALAAAWSLASTALAGVLYVANGGGNSVFSYSTPPPTSLGGFVPAGSGGLTSPRGIAFGPNGDLYVGGIGAIYEYSGTTGAFVKIGRAHV